MPPCLAVENFGLESSLVRFSIALLVAHPDNGWRIQKVDQQVARRYARMKTAPPPIIVSASGLILDGLHRVAAAILKNEKEIEGEQKWQS